jgi:hypothetical protein
MHKVFEDYLKEWKNRLANLGLDLFGEKVTPALPDFEYLQQLYQENWEDDNICRLNDEIENENRASHDQSNRPRDYVKHHSIENVCK